MNVLVSLTDKSGSDGFLKEISSIVDRIYASEGTKKISGGKWSGVPLYL